MTDQPSLSPEAIEPYVWQCTHEEYHADHSKLGHSMLEDFRRSRPLFHGRYIGKTISGREETDNMRLGSAFHSLVLEPSTYAARFAVLPETCNGEKLDRRKKTHKEFYYAWERDAYGKTVLSFEQDAAAQKMAQSVALTNAAAIAFRVDGIAEQSIVWSRDGLLRKCRIDYSLPSDHIIVDLKSTANPRPEAFAKQIFNLGYHRQGAWYQDGYEALYGVRPRVVLIAVHNAEPWETACYELSTDFLLLGDEDNWRDIKSLLECLRSDDWNNPESKQITTLGPPRWAVYQNEWELSE